MRNVALGIMQRIDIVLQEISEIFRLVGG